MSISKQPLKVDHKLYFLAHSPFLLLRFIDSPHHRPTIIQ